MKRTTHKNVKMIYTFLLVSLAAVSSGCVSVRAVPVPPRDPAYALGRSLAACVRSYSFPRYDDLGVWACHARAAEACVAAGLPRGCAETYGTLSAP